MMSCWYKSGFLKKYKFEIKDKTCESRFFFFLGANKYHTSFMASFEVKP